MSNFSRLLFPRISYRILFGPYPKMKRRGSPQCTCHKSRGYLLHTIVYISYRLVPPSRFGTQVPTCSSKCISTPWVYRTNKSQVGSGNGVLQVRLYRTGSRGPYVSVRIIRLIRFLSLHVGSLVWTSRNFTRPKFVRPSRLNWEIMCSPFSSRHQTVKIQTLRRNFRFSFTVPNHYFNTFKNQILSINFSTVIHSNGVPS